VDPETGYFFIKTQKKRRATRVEIVKGEDGSRQRKSKRSGVIIPKPDLTNPYEKRMTSRPKGPKDTAKEDVLKKTYDGENYVKVYKEFMNRIKEKENQEKLLVFTK